MTYSIENLKKFVQEAAGEAPAIRLIQKSETDNDLLKFPIIDAGVAGVFADAYSEISEAPRHFYLMIFLACLGAYLSQKITLKTLLKIQTRIFLILLGASGRGKKSTPINIATEFFNALLPEMGIMYNANSGEGLGVYLEKHPSALLVFDEFAGFVSKATQKGNTLLGAVTSFFESNQYQTATKDKQLLIENAYLSMVAASTVTTWERIWSPDFTAIGLINRLFLVPGGMEKLVSIPPRLPLDQWKYLRDETMQAIRVAERVREYDLTDEARDRYDIWYREELDHKSLHSIRLDTYALRLMLLLTIARQEEMIDLKAVEDAIALASWQHEVRQQYDPLDCDNESAKIEERIRRTLRLGARSARDLQRVTHANRSGLWLWKNALENLLGNGEVWFDPTTKLYGKRETE
jgi:hypothetical protein